MCKQLPQRHSYTGYTVISYHRCAAYSKTSHHTDDTVINYMNNKHAMKTTAVANSLLQDLNVMQKRLQ